VFHLWLKKERAEVTFRPLKKVIHTAYFNFAKVSFTAANFGSSFRVFQIIVLKPDKTESNERPRLCPEIEVSR
jgi:hypothetical protein